MKLDTTLTQLKETQVLSTKLRKNFNNNNKNLQTEQTIMIFLFQLKTVAGKNTAKLAQFSKQLTIKDRQTIMKNNKELFDILTDILLMK